MENENSVNTLDVQEKKKRRKGKFIIILIILLLLIGGAVAFIVTSPKPVKTKSDSKEVFSEYRMAGNSLEKFDLYFLKLENEAKNKLYSPLSIKYALGMLREGASGETKKQIDAVIGDYEVKKYENNNHMSFANSMFIRNSFKDQIIKEYSDNLVNKFNAEIIYDEFANATNMNNWIKEKTFNLIPQLVEDDKVKDSNFYLINALAIDMNWKNQIHCTVGHQVPCLNENGIYSVYYNHEKIPGGNGAYQNTSVAYTSNHLGEVFPRFKFNNKDDVQSSEVLADFNRYDIIKDLGEEKIRKEVSEAYKNWLASEEGQYQLKSNPEYTEADVNKYVDKYIDEIKSNYGKANNNTDFLLYDDKEVKVFAKDLQEYNGMNLQYVGIMPKEKELTDYVDNVKKEDIETIINSLKEVKLESFKEGVVTIIKGNIPFFKFEYELKLMEDLQKLGIENVFDINKSDLSKMIKEEKQFINDAKHKANIEFSNDGIKAAAATALGGFGATSGGFEYLYEVPVEKIDITFDKPYMFLIRDKQTGEIWFAGTVYEPIKD